MKLLSTFLLLFSEIIFSTQILNANPQIESNVAQIYKDYGVRILHKYNRDKYFGYKSKLPPANAQGAQISDEEILRLLPIIKEFLAFYPKDVIRKNLKVIYLLRELIVYGKIFGASYGKTGIYIKNEHKRHPYSKEFLLGTMHSEFSSILMNNYHFPSVSWENANHGNFKYIGRGRDMLGRAGNYSQTPELLTKGLICQYAQASVEEDFNMIVYWLFTQPNRLKSLAKKYPIIGIKLKLAIDFYHLVDSRIKF
ncbi:MAG: hypothetical protein P8Y49_01420 [Sulfurovaceae bacterium]